MHLNYNIIYICCRFKRKQILEHMHRNLPRTGNIIQKVMNIIVALFRSIQRAGKLVKYEIEEFPQ